LSQIPSVTHYSVDAADLSVGRGPHPAASPFEKRVGEALGLTAFGLYQIELPAGEETVPHDHVDDHAEDAYAVLVSVELARGDRPAARRTLDRVLAALADLEVEPSEETHRLRRRVPSERADTS